MAATLGNVNVFVRNIEQVSWALWALCGRGITALIANQNLR
jgi:hypothetical protein